MSKQISLPNDTWSDIVNIGYLLMMFIPLQLLDAHGSIIYFIAVSSICIGALLLCGRIFIRLPIFKLLANE